nr:hypothetical protein [Tanacetum cinerariifolium]
MHPRLSVLFSFVSVNGERKPKKDKIGSKPNKNGKRGEAGKSQKQLQWIEEEKLKKTQKEGPEMQSLPKFIKERRKRGSFMGNTRQSTLEFFGSTFDEAVQRAVNALLPGLTAQITNELRQNGAGSNVDAKNWIAHIEKIFEVLGCADEFKARLASYKFEGDAFNWWKAFKQAKGGEVSMREYHIIRQKDGELNGEFMKRFLRLAGFVGKKAGPLEEQANHFKWALSECILDGIVNTEFTNVAQVANVGRNIELLLERGGGNNKRNCDGDRIQSANKNNNQRGYGQRGNDGRNYDMQGGNCRQRFYQQNQDQQYNRSSGSSRQKKYTDYTSPPLCDTCGKPHPGKECYRVTDSCFSCGLTGHMAKDCP